MAFTGAEEADIVFLFTREEDVVLGSLWEVDNIPRLIKAVDVILGSIEEKDLDLGSFSGPSRRTIYLPSIAAEHYSFNCCSLGSRYEQLLKS